MARTFPQAFETHRNMTTGAFPQRVLEIDHGGSIGVRYYAGSALSLGDATAEARVVEWGEQTLTAEPGRVGGYGTRQLSLADHDGVLRSRFDSERPGIQGRRARVWLWFNGTTWPTDAAVEFDGAVGEQCDWNAGSASWSITLNGIETATENETIGIVLSRENFPEVACAGTEGKILPVCYGDLVRRVPAVLIDKPGFGYLGDQLGIIDSVLTLNDTAGNLGFTYGETISLMVGVGGNCEVITGSFSDADDTTFSISSRGVIYAEGNLSGFSYNPSRYGVIRYGVIPHGQLPNGSSESSWAGYPILLLDQRDGLWYIFMVDAWFDTGLGFACVSMGDGWDFGTQFKLLRWPGTIPYWKIGTSVQELAPYRYVVNHLPSAGIDRVEARADIQGVGPYGQNRSAWFRYNPDFYTVDLDDQSYNTVLGRGSSDPGVTTIAINNPPAYYGFPDENIYVSLSATTDDGTDDGDPVVNPVRVIQSLLTDVGGVDPGKIDTAAFNAAASATSELAAFALLTERPLHDVCAELALQAGCLYFWDQGKAVVKKIPTGDGTSVWTADETKIARAGEGGPPALTYAALPAKGLVTELIGKWRLACQGPDLRLGRRSDTAVTEIGRKSQEWDMWAYQYPSSVASALEDRLLWMINRQRRVTFRSFLPAYHLQPGDVITVSLSVGGSPYFGPMQAVVVSRKDTPGDALRGQMEMVEITADVRVWGYEVAAIPAGPDACLHDTPPEFETGLLDGAVSDGIGVSGGITYLPPFRGWPTPWVPEADEHGDDDGEPHGMPDHGHGSHGGGDGDGGVHGDEPWPHGHGHGHGHGEEHGSGMPDHGHDHGDEHGDGSHGDGDGDGAHGHGDEHGDHGDEHGHGMPDHGHGDEHGHGDDHGGHGDGSHGGGDGDGGDGDGSHGDGGDHGDGGHGDGEPHGMPDHGDGDGHGDGGPCGPEMFQVTGQQVMIDQGPCPANNCSGDSGTLGLSTAAIECSGVPITLPDFTPAGGYYIGDFPASTHPVQGADLFHGHKLVVWCSGATMRWARLDEDNCVVDDGTFTTWDDQQMTGTIEGFTGTETADCCDGWGISHWLITVS